MGALCDFITDQNPQRDVCLVFVSSLKYIGLICDISCESKKGYHTGSIAYRRGNLLLLSCDGSGGCIENNSKENSRRPALSLKRF